MSTQNHYLIAFAECRHAFGQQGSVAKLFTFGFAVAASFCLMALVPSALLSGSAAFAAAVATCFCFGLMVCLARSRNTGETAFSIAIYSWWFLIVSEQVFVRKGLSEAGLSGKFAGDAYGEVFIWTIIFLSTFSVFGKRGFMPSILRTPVKWLFLFALLAIVSCAYSPTPMFSFAWAFKLMVGVLILIACAEKMGQARKQVTFWKSLFWAYVVLVFTPLATCITHPQTMFGWRGFDGSQPPEFRLNTNIHPVDLSQHAAILVILALVLHAVDRRRSRMAVVALAVIVMILAVGKAAILSCIVCSILFFILQGRFKAGIGWLLLVLGTGLLAVFVTPIGSYFQEYESRESAETLTGRTELWDLAIPAIKQRPIIGHGFVASKFISEAVDADWDAGHLHNAFLEVLYNNGVVGLLLMLIVNGCIVRNVWVILRQSRDHTLRTLAAGSFALYVFLLLNGFVEPTFGGRPSCVFLVFQGLLLLTYSLRTAAAPEQVEIRRAVLHEWSPAEI
jgi:O-antigen ligase